MSQVLGLSKNLTIFQKSKNLPKFWKSSKILKIFQKSENLPKIWKSSKNQKIVQKSEDLPKVQKSENLPKIWKSSKNLKIFQKSENLPKICLIKCLKGHKSLGSLFNCFLDVKIKRSLSEWLSQWQGHLLSCCGQLKKHPVHAFFQSVFSHCVFLRGLSDLRVF